MALTNADAKIVLGMVARGDSRHHIAAWFGENQARIAEVEQGSHGQQTPAPPEDLPPKGPPGLKGRRMRAFAAKALKALEEDDLEAARQALEAGLARFDSNEA
ncbi:MAG: hypothetical protein HKN27_02475 [Silicimonas sp.]|nr:hypothetical protein [Silicimonas sp.]